MRASPAAATARSAVSSTTSTSGQMATKFDQAASCSPVEMRLCLWAIAKAATVSTYVSLELTRRSASSQTRRHICVLGSAIRIGTTADVSR
ncbi:hypothetical protein BN12_170021 [Nostocoides japonicum T1-X7]|uniref:Uncharacterized protein n=1 Tax=Nostocoides japonicum T1-X7 TaxID=1194083 RepID=A0A077LYX4_9MICO|nr:hypothetical protein BN12_170021 [Tetrasphaera japonica T1-X7]